jgi:hypothetical protein
MIAKRLGDQVRYSDNMLWLVPKCHMSSILFFGVEIVNKEMKNGNISPLCWSISTTFRAVCGLLKEHLHGLLAKRPSQYCDHRLSRTKCYYLLLIFYNRISGRFQ